MSRPSSCPNPFACLSIQYIVRHCRANPFVWWGEIFSGMSRNNLLKTQ